MGSCCGERRHGRFCHNHGSESVWKQHSIILAWEVVGYGGPCSSWGGWLTFFAYLHGIEGEFQCGSSCRGRITWTNASSSWAASKFVTVERGLFDVLFIGSDMILPMLSLRVVKWSGADKYPCPPLLHPDFGLYGPTGSKSWSDRIWWEDDTRAGRPATRVK